MTDTDVSRVAPVAGAPIPAAITVELSRDDAEVVLGAVVRQLDAGSFLERLALLSLVCQLRHQLEREPYEAPALLPLGTQTELAEAARIVHHVEVEHLRLTWRARCAGCNAAVYRRDRAAADAWAVMHEADVEDMPGAGGAA